MIHRLQSNSLVRYVVSGGISYGLELSTLLALHSYFGFSVTTSTAIAFWVGLLVSFSLQKLVTFNNRSKDTKAVSRQFALYGILILFNYIFTLFFVSLIPSRFVILSRTLAIVLTTAWNYVIYKRIIFNSNSKNASVTTLKKHEFNQYLKQLFQVFSVRIESFIDVVLNYFRKFIAFLSKFTKTKFYNVSYSLTAWGTFLAVCLYIGRKASILQSYLGDEYWPTYSFSEIGHGVPQVASTHTNLLKLPILWLQGNLPYDRLSWLFLNISLIFLSFILLIYVFKKALQFKNMMNIGILIFAFILFQSYDLAINLTMATIRQIEYPIALLVIVWGASLLRQEKPFLTRYLGYTFLLGLFLLHDRSNFYVLIPVILSGTLLHAVYVTKKFKRIHLYGTMSVIASVALSSVVEHLLNGSGVINISKGYVSNNTIIGYDSLPTAVLLTIKQTFDLFGANIFGQKISSINLGLFMAAMVMLIGICSIYFVHKEVRKDIRSGAFMLHIFLLLFIIFTYASYIIGKIAWVGNERFLIGVVYIVVLYILWLFNTLRLRNKLIEPVFAMILILGIVIGIPLTKKTYIDAQSVSMPKILSVENISNILRKNRVEVVLNDYDYSSIRFFSDNSVRSVQMEECDKPYSWANNTSWIFSGRPKRTALLIDSSTIRPIGALCPQQTMLSIYGKPDAVIEVEGINTPAIPAFLWIYNYDIRTKLDTSEIRN